MSDWIRDLPDWRDHWYTPLTDRVRPISHRVSYPEKWPALEPLFSAAAAVSLLLTDLHDRQVIVSSSVLTPRDVLRKASRVHQLSFLPEWQYLRLRPTKEYLRPCLSHGYPFICGVRLGESWWQEAVLRKETGIVRMPTLNEPTIGGVVILVAGWNPTTKMFRGLLKQRDQPTFESLLFPANYLLNYADDFWTVRKA